MEMSSAGERGAPVGPRYAASSKDITMFPADCLKARVGMVVRADLINLWALMMLLSIMVWPRILDVEVRMSRSGLSMR